MVAGDSAGAMAVLMALIENKRLVEGISAAFFFSPWTDLTLSGRSLFANAGHDPLFGPAALLHKVFYYVGEQSVNLRRASPLWSDLTALPPMLVQVGSTEVMLDDSTRLVERARAAGVTAQLDVWEQMPHVFQIDDSIPEAARALARISEFVSETLRRT